MEPPPIVARELPFARRDVVVEAVRVSVVDDGPRGARETLLFLHGNPAWSFLWRRFLAAGKEAGRRVVAPDLAGFGLSDKPRDAAYHTLERHVANLDAVATERTCATSRSCCTTGAGPSGWASRCAARSA